MTKSVARTSNKRKRQKAENRSRRQVEWSSKLTKVSAAAVALAAISGAAVTFKDNLAAFFGTGGDEQLPAVQDPLANEVGTDREGAKGSPRPPSDHAGGETPSLGTRMTERTISTVTSTTPGGVQTVESTIHSRSWIIRCAPGWTQRGPKICEPPMKPSAPPPVGITCPEGTVPQKGRPCPNGTVVPVSGELRVGRLQLFFDWSEADISDSSLEILGQAALQYHSNPDVRIALFGHADRSGPDGYNMVLSQRRAENARRSLADHGVPDEAIATRAFGESSPAVDTADGVREPQNRRVEITFGPK